MNDADAVINVKELKLWVYVEIQKLRKQGIIQYKERIKALRWLEHKLLEAYPC